MTDTPDQAALVLALQEAAADGVPVLTRNFGMVEHAVSKRRYVVETVELGPLGMLQLWSPVPFATAQLAAFTEAEFQARTGIMRGATVPDALRHLTDLGGRLGDMFGPNGAPN